MIDFENLAQAMGEQHGNTGTGLVAAGQRRAIHANQGIDCGIRHDVEFVHT